MLEGMLGSAGELDLAARVRPSTRKPGRVEEPGDGTNPVDMPSPDDTTPGEDPSATA